MFTLNQLKKRTAHDHLVQQFGDVRGSPLAVIVGLVDSRMVHTTPRLASLYSP